jgi:hypothetical protein
LLAIIPALLAVSVVIVAYLRRTDVAARAQSVQLTRQA